jgi:hypothetical protein
VSGDSPLNPVDVENAIAEIRNRIANGVEVVSQRYEADLDAKRALDVGFAKAYEAATGSIKDREYSATIETEELRAAYDRAHVAFKYAEKRAQALVNELSACQAILNSIRTMYGSVRS